MPKKSEIDELISLVFCLIAMACLTNTSYQGFRSNTSLIVKEGETAPSTPPFSEHISFRITYTNNNTDVTSLKWPSGTSPNCTAYSPDFYLINTGNVASTYVIQMMNLNPSNLTDYLTLGWNNGAGLPLSPNQKRTIWFTLKVGDLKNTTWSFPINFAFNILITATQT